MGRKNKIGWMSHLAESLELAKAFIEVNKIKKYKIVVIWDEDK